MAITLVQGPTYATSASPTTCSFTNTPAEGNLLIVYIRIGEANMNNVSVAGFTLAVESKTDTTRCLGIYYKTAGAAESKDVVVTCAGQSPIVIIEEWTGLAAPVLDKTASTPDTGSTTTSRSSGTTATTSAAEELAVVWYSPSASTSAQSLSNSFSQGYFSSPLFTGYKILSSAAAQESTLSWTTSRQCGGCIATFMATPMQPAACYLHARRDRMNTKAVSTVSQV